MLDAPVKGIGAVTDGFPMTTTPPVSQDAALVLGLAGTALPFAGSNQAEAERWLRVLRLHGHVGAVLQRMGVTEGPLETMADPQGAERQQERRERDEDAVAKVAEHAAEFARLRNGTSISTVDVLFGVIRVYDKDFDRALYVRSTDRRELLDRLSAALPASFAG
ncbi:MAG: hypothetical protein QOK04_1065 [Solirubrobacteraceae bacterium]|nr:hypothetical protein [Solirubrobacteraceae bacterium]